MSELISNISIYFGSVNFDNWTNLLNKLTNHKIIHIDISRLLDKSFGNLLHPNSSEKRILIVLLYSDVELLSKNNNFNKLRPYFHYILIPNYNTVRLLDNHHSFSSFMMKHNMNDLIPKIYNPHQESLITGGYSIQYPCVLKQNSNSYGGNSTYVINDYIDLKQKKDKSISWIIKELIIDKTEYVTHILAINGKIINSITYGTIFKTDHHIKHGASDTHIRDDHGYFFSDIIRLLNYTGFACVDYKMKDGKPKIFEINPRPGGSLIAETKDIEIMLNKLIEAIK